jgi:ABC transporter substrate binding protein
MPRAFAAMSRPFSHLLPACTSFVRVSYRKSFRIFGAGKRGRNRRGQKKHHAFPDGVLIRYFKSAEALAPVLKVKLVSLGVHDADEIERGLTTFAAERNGGVVVGPHAVTLTNRDLIVALAARLRLPALYPLAFYARAGGLISYGFDPVNQFQQGAGYIDRILRGARPADLPVQYPTKLQLAINLKTAKALGLRVQLASNIAKREIGPGTWQFTAPAAWCTPVCRRAVGSCN